MTVLPAMEQTLRSSRCPVDNALVRIAGKWKPIILWRLSAGVMRHAALQRALPGVSQRMLTLHLRELERDGLVKREVFAEVPTRVEYSLTPPAQRLLPLLEAFGHWWLDAGPELSCAAQAIAPDNNSPNVRVFRIRR